jgi:hypothetical protein
VTIGTATIRTSGRYSYAVTPSTRGSYVFRTVKPSAECTPLGCALRVSGSRSITLTVG